MNSRRQVKEVCPHCGKLISLVDATPQIHSNSWGGEYLNEYSDEEMAVFTYHVGRDGNKCPMSGQIVDKI
jgi:hypothetical protein